MVSTLNKTTQVQKGAISFDNRKVAAGKKVAKYPSKTLQAWAKVHNRESAGESEGCAQ